MMEHSKLKGKRILIVDDEPDVLDTLEELLSMCDLLKADAFAEAKEILETESLDMVILDIMGVDGYKLLEVARGKDLPAVMLTANALTLEDTVRSYQKGAAFFVPKEKMVQMESILNDVFEAREKGVNHWFSWLERMSDYYEQRFGPNWKENHSDFWEALEKQDWRLASRLRE